MSYHRRRGLGQFATGDMLSQVNTQAPIVQTGNIAAQIAATFTPMTVNNNPPVQATGAIGPVAIVKEAAGCAAYPGTMPIMMGEETFHCVKIPILGTVQAPAVPDALKNFMLVATGGAAAAPATAAIWGAGSTGTKTVTGMTDPGSSAYEGQSSGSGTPASGTVTESAFKAACVSAQIGGKLGPGPCCATPKGSIVLVAGKPVAGSCTPSSGIGTVAVVAGAAVAALLLMKMM